jgi:uncharacterized NAD(P)/FAD-binding protein YdhS
MLEVAVVGGGASGTLASVQLLRQAAAASVPLRVWLIDQDGRHGLGQAYSTTHADHLLNAVAAKMSALPGEPDHLLDWARDEVAGPVGPAAFLPRRVYGRYLRDTLAQAERAARPTARLTRITAEVTAIRPAAGPRAATLSLSDGELGADVVILATGNVPARLPFGVPESDRIITAPWLPGALDGILGEPGDSVVVIGTGLTMLDLAIQITAAKPAARVLAVSRHGMLPRPHPGDAPDAARPAWLPAFSGTTGTVRLTDLTRQVRSAVAANPAGWHAVMEDLRPCVPGLWRAMPDRDRQVFLRSLARYWEVHRHLMPPATASRIAALRQTGQLTLHRGRVTSVRPPTGRPGQLSVLIDAGHGTVELETDWLVNGIGGTTDVRATASPLLRDLFATGLAQPDSLGLGIDATARGEVISPDGRPAGFLYALGPPLRGLWYETTAIPEIAGQAAALGAQVIAGRPAVRRPGSAA